MSKMWEAFKEVLIEEQLSDEVKMLLFAKLIPTIAETFYKILSEEPLSVEVKNALLFKFIRDLVDLQSPIIEVQVNPRDFGVPIDRVELESSTLAQMNLESPNIEVQVNPILFGLSDAQIKQIQAILKCGPEGGGGQ